MHILVLSFGSGVVLSILNYLIIRTKGYTSYTFLILGFFAFSSVAYMFLKLFYKYA